MPSICRVLNIVGESHRLNDKRQVGMLTSQQLCTSTSLETLGEVREDKDRELLKRLESQSSSCGELHAKANTAESQDTSDSPICNRDHSLRLIVWHKCFVRVCATDRNLGPIPHRNISNTT